MGAASGAFKLSQVRTVYRPVWCLTNLAVTIADGAQNKIQKPARGVIQPHNLITLSDSGADNGAGSDHSLLPFVTVCHTRGRSECSGAFHLLSVAFLSASIFRSQPLASSSSGRKWSGWGANAESSFRSAVWRWICIVLEREKKGGEKKSMIASPVRPYYFRRMGPAPFCRSLASLPQYLLITHVSGPYTLSLCPVSSSCLAGLSVAQGHEE